MNKPNDDGGPAFPASIPIVHNDDQGKDYLHYEEAGMSLRDYFAAHAPISEPVAEAAALITGEQKTKRYGDVYCRLLAEHAYRYADAMIAERGKPITSTTATTKTRS